ncbi:MAG: hypothetical protein AAF437_00730 [Pseudomonadota bacterium]
MRHDPITKSNWPEAVELLCEGFDKTTPDFWNRGLERWSLLVDDPFAEPLGYITRGKNDDGQAVLLTFHSPIQTDGYGRAVNCSSWYVRDKYRLFAPTMLRQICDQSGKTFTDFTPTASVEKVLLKSGYESLNHRHAVFPLHLLCVLPSLRVVGQAATLAKASGARLSQRTLEDHAKIGCLVFGIETETGISPVVLRVVTRKHVLRTAEILYAADTTLLVGALPGIARKLWWRGVMLIECGLPESTAVKLPYRDRGVLARYVKGPWPEDCIDYLYSEKPILGV